MGNAVTDEITQLLEARDSNDIKKSAKKATPVKAKKVKKLTKKEQQILDMSRATYLPKEYITVWTVEQLIEMIDFFKKQEVIAVDTETYGVEVFKHDTVGFSIYSPTRGYYVPINHDMDISHNMEERERVDAMRFHDPVVGVDYVKCLPRETVVEYVKPLLEDRSKKFIGHNCKFDSHVLRNWYGIRIHWYYDTMIGQALLDENQSKRLKDMAVRYLKVQADTFGKLFGRITFDKVPILLKEDRSGNLASFYAIKDTHLTYDMYEFQINHLNSPHLAEIKSLMFDIEMPFLHILTDAEERGVKLDSEYLLEEVAPKLHEELGQLVKDIHKRTGDINLNSPQQLSKAMYTDLKLPRMNPKKPNTTDKKTLSKLISTSRAILRDVEGLVNTVMSDSKGKHYREAGTLHEFIYGRKLGRLPRAEVVEIATEVFTIGAEMGENILEYRSKSKLTSSFADKLPLSAINGRVHTSFSSVGAVTGRMSSSNPNLQQIPSRVGGLIRNAFIADEGRVLASIDFSQQELRVLTHISKDPVLMDIYKNGGDVHATTAVGMWNRKHPEEQITYDQYQYGRGMSDLFRDENGNVDESRFNKGYTDQLVTDGHIKEKVTDFDELKKWVILGDEFETFRDSAKTVNFGIIYGMAEMGLSDTLDISEEEAKAYIDGYFDAYPGVKKWMGDEENSIMQSKHTTTLMGRKRRLYPELDSGKRWLIESAIRMGINAIIQGSSADMVKIASIKMQPLLEELDMNILMWVHDEILFDAPEGIGKDNLERVSAIMCNALPLDCGLASDIEVGRKWGQRMSDDDMLELFEGVR